MSRDVADGGNLKNEMVSWKRLDESAHFHGNNVTLMLGSVHSHERMSLPLIFFVAFAGLRMGTPSVPVWVKVTAQPAWPVTLRQGDAKRGDELLVFPSLGPNFCCE